MGGKPQRVETIFYGGKWPLDTPSKDIYLVIRGGLCWMKWLQNGAEKGFIFHEIIPHCILFYHSFIGQVKEPLYSVCLNLNYEEKRSSDQMKVEKMVAFLKTFN